MRLEPLKINIANKRIYLKNLEVRDITPEYISWLNDPAVCKFISTYGFRQTYQKVRSYVESFKEKGDRLLLGIFLKANNRHIGNLTFSHIDRKDNFAAIGICIGIKELWGNGYGEEALDCAKKIAFQRLKLNRLEAGALIANTGSVRLFKKCGFKVEGRLREKEIKDGIYHDALIMALLKKDYLRIS